MSWVRKSLEANGNDPKAFTRHELKSWYEQDSDEYLRTFTSLAAVGSLANAYQTLGQLHGMLGIDPRRGTRAKDTARQALWFVLHCRRGEATKGPSALALKALRVALHAEIGSEQLARADRKAARQIVDGEPKRQLERVLRQCQRSGGFTVMAERCRRLDAEHARRIDKLCQAQEAWGDDQSALGELVTVRDRYVEQARSIITAKHNALDATDPRRPMAPESFAEVLDAPSDADEEPPGRRHQRSLAGLLLDAAANAGSTDPLRREHASVDTLLRASAWLHHAADTIERRECRAMCDEITRADPCLAGLAGEVLSTDGRLWEAYGKALRSVADGSAPLQCRATLKELVQQIIDAEAADIGLPAQTLQRCEGLLANSRVTATAAAVTREVEDCVPCLARANRVADMLTGLGVAGGISDEETTLVEACTILAQALDDDSGSALLKRRLQGKLEDVRGIIADWAREDSMWPDASSPPPSYRRRRRIAEVWQALGRDPVELAPAHVREHDGINVAYQYRDDDMRKLLEPLDKVSTTLSSLAPLNSMEDACRELRADLQKHGDRERQILLPLNLSAGSHAMTGHWTALVVTVTQGKRGPVATAVYLDPLSELSSLPPDLEAQVGSLYDAAPWSFETRPVKHAVQQDGTSCGVHVVHDLRQIALRWAQTGQGPEKTVPWKRDIVDVRREHAELLAAAGEKEFWVRQLLELHWVPQADLGALLGQGSSEDAVRDGLASLPPEQADRVLAQPSAECLRQTTAASGSFVRVQAGPYGTADDVVRRAATLFRESAPVTTSLAMMPPEAASRLGEAFRSNDDEPGPAMAAVRRVLIELLGEAGLEGDTYLRAGPQREACRSAFLVQPAADCTAAAATSSLASYEALSDGIERFGRIGPTLEWLESLPQAERERLLEVARTTPQSLSREAQTLWLRLQAERVTEPAPGTGDDGLRSATGDVWIEIPKITNQPPREVIDRSLLLQAVAFHHRISRLEPMPSSAAPDAGNPQYQGSAVPS